MRSFSLSIVILLFCPQYFLAQGTLADYQRAQDIQTKSTALVANAPGPTTWIAGEHRFWYHRSVKGGGSEFVIVDADTHTKTLAFDHAKLAAAISAVTGKTHTALTLPFAPQPRRPGTPRPPAGSTSPLKILAGAKEIEFGFNRALYHCSLTNYACTNKGSIPLRSATNPAPSDDSEVGGNPVNGLTYKPPASQNGDEGEWGRAPHGCGPEPQSSQNTAPSVRSILDVGGQFPDQLPLPPPEACASFDGKWEAFIQNFNVFLKPAGATAGVPLSTDGTEGNYYTIESIAWSPDSQKLVAYRTRPGYDREIPYIESSPPDQIQPKLLNIHYLKPGDALDIARPVLFDIAGKTQIEIDNTLFPNPYALSPPVWWKDSRAFTFEYNQRGHQAYTVIEVNARSGQARPLIAETSKTFIYYNNLGPGLSAGRRYRHDLNDGKEIIWASERDGWEHLYLYDGITGRVKNQITRGAWLVRNVLYVDDDKRQIFFEAGGMIPSQDPYFTQACRINFDGSGLTKLTDANGTHSVSFSKDRQYYTDTWQRVDLPPNSQLRRTSDQQVVMDLEKANGADLLTAGLRYPEVFVAKGRDGVTDIWGLIIRPTNFDPSKKYPVIENIYAGPQGSFVPKTFNAVAADQALAELGFIVVHIDGMGTSNRSKAFHDVAFQNLGDAGFPDRILWHKTVASKYPYYDISRVGIFGTSAGGQSALGGALFYPDFYKVVVSNSGCHDNRMDKLWWNEQWMGWPVGPQYAASSNVDHAKQLKGKALIVIGEMDSNVDPASSLQVVNALVKAHKHFDMLFIPGENHGVGILADEHYRDDYFVHNLLGVEPPDWNKVSLKEVEKAR